MQILRHRETVVQVTTEYENVRLALTWFEERGDLAALLNGVALYGFWIARGLLNEAYAGWNGRLSVPATVRRQLGACKRSTVPQTWRCFRVTGASGGLHHGEPRGGARIG